MDHVLNFVILKFVSWGCFQGAETPCGFLWKLFCQKSLSLNHRLTFSIVLSFLPSHLYRRIGRQQGQIQVPGRRDGLHLCRVGRILSIDLFIYVHMYWFRTFPQRVPHAPLEKRKTGNAPQPARCERKRKRERAEEEEELNVTNSKDSIVWRRRRSGRRRRNKT